MVPRATPCMPCANIHATKTDSGDGSCATADITSTPSAFSRLELGTSYIIMPRDRSRRDNGGSSPPLYMIRWVCAYEGSGPRGKSIGQNAAYFLNSRIRVSKNSTTLVPWSQRFSSTRLRYHRYHICGEDHAASTSTDNGNCVRCDEIRHTYCMLLMLLVRRNTTYVRMTPKPPTTMTFKRTLPNNNKKKSIWER